MYNIHFAVPQKVTQHFKSTIVKKKKNLKKVVPINR